MAEAQAARRGVAYLRVSTNPQERGTSMEGQFAACKLKADAAGIELIAVERDVESGASLLAREGLLRAIERIENREVDTLLVYDMSRYSRDLEHQQAIRRRVEAAGGQLVFATREYGGDTSDPQGRLLFGIDGVFAEYERLVIRSRMMRGQKARAQQGRQPSAGKVAWGYVVVTHEMVLRGLYPPEDIGLYRTKPELEPIIPEIFKRAAAGESLSAICRWLDAQGVPTPRGRKLWGTPSLSYILHNSTYAGRAVWGLRETMRDESRLERGLSSRLERKREASETITISCPALISEDLFDSVQKTLRRGKLFGGNPERCFLLSGLLRCPNCGLRVYGRSGNPHTRKDGTRSVGPRTYICEGTGVFIARNKGFERPQCRQPRIHADVVEEQFIQALLSYLGRSGALREALDQSAPAAPAQEAERAALQKQLAALDKQEGTLIEAQLRAIDAGISSAPYEARLRDLGAKRRPLAERLHEVEALCFTHKPVDTAQRADVLATAIEEIQEVLASPHVLSGEKRALLMRFVESVSFEGEGKQVHNVKIRFLA